MNHKERLELTDSIESAIGKLAEGNPGAIKVAAALYRNSQVIDPVGCLGGLAPLMQLDSFGIYGTDIWVLYKDICRSSVVHTLAVLRGAQVGLISTKVLAEACHKQDGSGRAEIPAESLLHGVMSIVPQFNQV